jgi:ATP-dependent exoDNAse (exonuclease V) beta subunit (contains helicase and exonuclease domains)
VPYRVESGSLIYRTQEVRDLVNCLTAIDDPADEVAIVAALRSPAFACSDIDLARHRAAGGRFNYHHRDVEIWGGPVGRGCARWPNSTSLDITHRWPHWWSDSSSTAARLKRASSTNATATVSAARAS